MICTPSPPFAKCSDNTLQIEFEYPAVWGEIEAILRAGGYRGYAYDYTFSALLPEQALFVWAGGRSKDFGEGRGGMMTDFKGYVNETPGSICASTRDYYPICEEIKPDVVLLMTFPEAKYICDPAPGIPYSPIAIIEINLPDNSIINGFRFVLPFLSESSADKVSTDLQEVLGYTPDTFPQKCDDESQREFDSRVTWLIESIQTDSVDSRTKENINTLEHIAESVIFQEN